MNSFGNTSEENMFEKCNLLCHNKTTELNTTYVYFFKQKAIHNAIIKNRQYSNNEMNFCAFFLSENKPTKIQQTKPITKKRKKQIKKNIAMPYNIIKKHTHTKRIDK